MKCTKGFYETARFGGDGDSGGSGGTDGPDESLGENPGGGQVGDEGQSMSDVGSVGGPSDASTGVSDAMDSPGGYGYGGLGPGGPPGAGGIEANYGEIGNIGPQGIETSPGATTAGEATGSPEGVGGIADTVMENITKGLKEQIEFAKQNPVMMGVRTALSLPNPFSIPVNVFGTAMNALGATPGTSMSNVSEEEGANDPGGDMMFAEAPTPAPAPAPAPPPPPFQLGPPPDVLNLSSAMSPLQMRAAIATGGVAGNTGLYQSDIARNYYRDLLRDLRQEQGDFQVADLLPVEGQFFNALGITSNYPNTDALLTAIAAS